MAYELSERRRRELLGDAQAAEPLPESDPRITTLDYEWADDPEYPRYLSYLAHTILAEHGIPLEEPK